MRWNSFKKRKEKIFLTLDIGTEAVKALVFSIPEEKKEKKIITVLGVGREYFNNRNFEIEIIKRAVLETVGKAHQNLSFSLAKKEIKKKARKQKKWQILLGLPPNILKARVVYQSLDKKKPKERISKREERIFCNQIFESAKEKISKEFSKEFGILPKDISWISLKVLEMKIDGYPVSSFKGYQGKKLELKILVTFLPKFYFENIKRIIDSLQFKTLKIVHLAENLSIISNQEKRNGFFIDVGGDITQILRIKDGQLEQIDEFEGGAKAFIRSLCQTLGVDEETARIMGERYSKKISSAEVSQRMKEIFLSEKKAWYENFKKKLEKINLRGLFPSTIFLFGGGSSFPEIQNVLEENSTYGSPTIEFVFLKDLENIKDTTRILDDPQYIPSLLISCSVINYK